MPTRSRSLRTASAALAVLGLLLAGARASAQKSSQTETEGEFVRYDAEAGTMTIQVRKPGKGAKPPRQLKLKKGKEGVFKVKAEGTVLTRTTVKLQNGTAGAFTDLEPGRKVLVFWITDPEDENARFARSVSVFVPAEDQGEDAGMD